MRKWHNARLLAHARMAKLSQGTGLRTLAKEHFGDSGFPIAACVAIEWIRVRIRQVRVLALDHNLSYSLECLRGDDVSPQESCRQDGDHGPDARWCAISSLRLRAW